MGWPQKWKWDDREQTRGTSVCLLPCGRTRGNRGAALEHGVWDRGRGKASLKRPRTQLGHDAQI